MRAHNRLTAWAALSLGLFASACAEGVDNRRGVEAVMQVAGAQYVPGNLPPAAGGPTVQSLDPPRALLVPGLAGVSCPGRADVSAQSVLLQRQGDPGYWIVPVGAFDPAEPSTRAFTASLSFQRSLPTGAMTLLSTAVNATGQVGVVQSRDFTVIDQTPQGALVVSLSWDSDADLDLHMNIPAALPGSPVPTTEIWSGRISNNTSTPPNRSAATLDFDSNAGCVLDNKRVENIVIPENPPNGHYVVRVDTANLCGQVAARWRVALLVDGVLQREARGVAVGADGYPAQGTDLKFGQDKRAGTETAGVTALEFDW